MTPHDVATAIATLQAQVRALEADVAHLDTYRQEVFWTAEQLGQHPDESRSAMVLRIAAKLAAADAIQTQATKAVRPRNTGTK